MVKKWNEHAVKMDSPNLTHCGYAFGYPGNMVIHYDDSMFEDAAQELVNYSTLSRYETSKWAVTNKSGHWTIDSYNGKYAVTYTY